MISSLEDVRARYDAIIRKLTQERDEWQEAAEHSKVVRQVEFIQLGKDLMRMKAENARLLKLAWQASTQRLSELSIAQARDFLMKWDADDASNMNITNVKRLQSILEGNPQGGYIPHAGLEGSTALPIAPISEAELPDIESEVEMLYNDRERLHEWKERSKFKFKLVKSMKALLARIHGIAMSEGESDMRILDLTREFATNVEIDWASVILNKTRFRAKTCATCDHVYCTSKENGVLDELVKLCSVKWNFSCWKPHPLWTYICELQNLVKKYT